ncbi:MAG: pirin family protein [Candidatus Poseidoniales archaeon]
MMSTSARHIESVVPTHVVLEGGGFKVRRPVAMGRLMSPFLLLDEMGPVNYGPREAIGAPDHPHRGFETVTYMLSGCMQHADSAGNKGDLNPGDVQWMTAGRGVIHSELPHPDFYETGGLMHGFQIWVNLPAKDKMMAPRYQDIMSEALPVVESEDKLIWAKVIAGKALGAEAIIDTVIPITYIHMRLKPGAVYTHECEQDHNIMVYVFGGSVKIGKKSVQDGELGLSSPGESLTLEAGANGAEFLILGGPEINEPIARYGPFVMNTREEIMQAIVDYNNGTLA